MARNNSKRTTNKCPLKRATAYKTRKEGQALVLRELKWPILAIVIFLGIFLLFNAGVDLTQVADLISSARGLVVIGGNAMP
ncbi:hypothetical protein RKD55_004744 [Rossellomorea marisflavi]